MILLLLFLLLLPSTLFADCIPWEIQLSEDTIKGCEKDLNLYKQRNVRVMFPDGFFKDIYPAGNGGCGQSTSCDATEFLLLILKGLTECWPQVDEAVRTEGMWSQTFHNMSPMPKYKECGNSALHMVAGPIECVENPLTMSRTWTVPHTCQYAGGGRAGGIISPTPPFVWDIPCPWVQTFVSAMPSCLPEPPCTWGFELGRPSCLVF